MFNKNITTGFLKRCTIFLIEFIFDPYYGSFIDQYNGWTFSQSVTKSGYDIVI